MILFARKFLRLVLGTRMNASVPNHKMHRGTLIAIPIAAIGDEKVINDIRRFDN
jgi:hypothetical protein